MSPSDAGTQATQDTQEAGELGRLSREVAQLVDRLLDSEAPEVLPVEDLRRLFSSAVRLYGGVSAVVDEDVDPLDGDVTPTDAVVAACALLKSHNLNPFDLSLWFSRSRVASAATPNR
jgi:hypothetical protein